MLGKFHGQRRLASYSSWGHRESDTTEQSSTHTYTVIWGKTVGQNMVKMVPNISIAKISIEYINLTVKEKGTLRLQNNKISK